MIIACDVDGVVADLHSAWLEKYNRDYNDTFTSEQWTGWAIHDMLKPECGKKFYDYLNDPNLYAGVMPIPGAIGGIDILRALGHRVFFATDNAKNMTEQKWAWLEQHRLIPNGAKDFVITGDKSLVRADVLIDDALHNVKAFDGSRILFDRPWNRHEVGTWTRLSDWPNVVRWIGVLNSHRGYEP